MNILLPIKQVPETSAVRMDEATGTMIREGVEAIINPLDLYAIELALTLIETHGGTCTALTMGPANAQAALREAIAMGVDQGVLICDRRFAGADTWSTAYVLAEAAKTLAPFDLILCGERATDGDTGQVGPGLAAFLDLPVASYVSQVESLTPPGIAPATPAVCRCHRLVEDGHEIVDIDLPCVMTVVKEVATPRLPTLRGKQKSRTIDLPLLTADDLPQLDQTQIGLKGSPTRVVKIFKPKVTRDGEILPAHDQASIEQAADRVVQYLQKQSLL